MSMTINFHRNEQGEIKSFHIHCAGVEISFDVPEGCSFNDLSLCQWTEGKCTRLSITDHEAVEIKYRPSLQEQLKKFIDFQRDQEARSMGLTQRARHDLERGAKYPYDGGDWYEDENSVPPPAHDWAHAAARGILSDLCDRRFIKWELEKIEHDVRKDIIYAAAEIIRLALSNHAGVR